MKVKVAHKFRDKYTETIHYKGEVLEMTEERFQEIQRAGNYVVQIAQTLASEPVADEVNDVSADAAETAETPAVASEDVPADAAGDGFDEMSIRELKEYAESAYKLTFKNGMKKSEIIEVLRRREQHG